MYIHREVRWKIGGILALDNGERKSPNHIPVSSGNGTSVSTEQEVGWKAELVWMLKWGGKTRYSCRECNKDSSDFKPAAYTIAILTHYANTPL